MHSQVIPTNRYLPNSLDAAVYMLHVSSDDSRRFIPLCSFFACPFAVEFAVEFAASCRRPGWEAARASLHVSGSQGGWAVTGAGALHLHQLVPRSQDFGVVTTITMCHRVLWNNKESTSKALRQGQAPLGSGK